MTRVSKLASAVGTAILMGYGSGAFALPDGYAEASLNLYNLVIREGTGATGQNFFNTILDNITISNVDSNGTSSANLNDVAPPAAETQSVTGQPAGTAFAIYTQSGIGYLPNLHYGVGTYAGTSFAGGTSSTYGNLLFEAPTAYPALGPVPATSDSFDRNNVANSGPVVIYPVGSSACNVANVGDCVKVQSQVNLVTNGTGAANSSQGVATNVDIIIGGAATWVELGFQADGFLRAELGQLFQSAFANYNWAAKVDLLVKNAFGVFGTLATIFTWNPDGGLAGSLDGNFLVRQGVGGACNGTNFSGLGVDCREFADAFAMNGAFAAVAALAGPDVRSIVNPIGNFEAELFLRPLSAFAQCSTVSNCKYTFSVIQNTLANATAFAPIPEPTSLALIGLGMLGMGAVSRRRKA